MCEYASIRYLFIDGSRQGAAFLPPKRNPLDSNRRVLSFRLRRNLLTNITVMSEMATPARRFSKPAIN